MNVNEEKRSKFIECAGKRVNNVLHDIQILEPMARSSVYDFTKQDIEEMFSAMQETLDNARTEFEKKFEEKVRSEKKVFSFGKSAAVASTPVVETVATETAINEVIADTTLETTSNEVIANEIVSETIPSEIASEEIINEPIF